jgi:UDP-2,3-diacylglucosamine hydrolase
MKADLKPGKKIYFASDFHFGIPDRQSSLERESKFIRWLNMVRDDACEIFLMGDLFDFWFEYKTTVPRGYVRLLGKLAEITDAGIPVHLFRGNHDMWAFSYLQEELHITLHREPEFREFSGKKIYLAHGDGLGPGDHGYKMIKRIFANRFNQRLFRMIHPDLGITMALFWSRKSRTAAIKMDQQFADRNIRLIGERITLHSENILKEHPDTSYLIYGHYHHPLVTSISAHAQQVVLGDWLTHFTYAEFDGNTLQMKTFTK